MTTTSDLDKQRIIQFSEEPQGQVAAAMQYFTGLPGCKAEECIIPNALRVSYNLHRHTLESLENMLAEAGFQLDRSMLRNIERNLIYYSEDTICHNMDIPMQPTKKNEREVFVKAYEQESHGDHDDIPPELREYK